MKRVYSYQEISTLIDQERQAVFTCSPEARVSVIQQHRDSERVTVTIMLSVRGTCVGLLTDDYASLLAVLDAFDIEAHAEIWELLDGEQASAVCVPTGRTRNMSNHQSTMQIGQRALVIEHEDFVAGYEQGVAGYLSHRQSTSQVSTTTLLWLIRNGFDGVTSTTWTTGYIVGWIVSMYESESDQKEGRG